MELGIAGKVALVTAASKGLGRASAEELSREGCRVAICSRTATEVERVCKTLDAQPEPVILVGHSMGGGVTQTAEHRPGKINTLVYLPVTFGLIWEMSVLMDNK